MREFPIHPDEVTPDWLEAILGGTVRSIEWQPIGTGQVGDSVRFFIDGEGVPDTLAGKFPAADATSRGTAAMMGLYAKEVGFYRTVAGALEARIPAVHFAAVDEAGEGFILLFEDLGPARRGDQIAGCTHADARHAIRQAAAIHAPSWNEASIVDAALLQPNEAITAQIKTMYPQAQAIFAERYAGTLEPEFMALCAELAEARDRFLDRTASNRAVVHGDFRLDNMLFDIKGGAEPIAILDWQTVTVGNPLTDIGYFMGCGIGDELRRAHEDALLSLYCDEMSQRGVPLSRDEIWHDYRIGALHGVTTAVFSAAFVERTERGDANFLSMARGACALALEHDSLGALRGER